MLQTFNQLADEVLARDGLFVEVVVADQVFPAQLAPGVADPDDVDSHEGIVVVAAGPGVAGTPQAAEDAVGDPLLVVQGEDHEGLAVVVLVSQGLENIHRKLLGAEPLGVPDRLVVSGSRRAHTGVDFGGAAGGEVVLSHLMIPLISR